MQTVLEAKVTCCSTSFLISAETNKNRKGKKEENTQKNFSSSKGTFGAPSIILKFILMHR
jgi:hypothetical protein